MLRATATALAFAAFASPVIAQTATTTPAPATTPPAATMPAPATPDAAAPAAPSAPATTATPAPGEPGSIPLPPGMTAQQAHDSARNQLGVLKYCEGKGWVTAESVAAQERMLGMLPEADAAAGQAAEDKGAAGTISVMGTELTLADGATQQNTTEEALCRQMGDMINTMAQQMPPA